MGLLELWQTDRKQVQEKRIDQLIAFAGESRLRDDNSTSTEFRSLLSVVSSDVIRLWIDQCLEGRFADFGFVLQDIVNEIGNRLGFCVSHGVYRGNRTEGLDGLWCLSPGRAILIESKSSTSYSINLQRIADYRKQIAPTYNLNPDEISILIVVGAEDTAEFEAQVRGSRYAWEIRILGIKSLVRLLEIKESLADPKIGHQIQEILFPQEFTRLDRIVDLVFATAEDANESDEDETEIQPSEELASTPRANFHAGITPRLERVFETPLVRRSRVLWQSPDDKILVSCQVSKKFDRPGMVFWFGLKRSTKEQLESLRTLIALLG